MVHIKTRLKLILVVLLTSWALPTLPHDNKKMFSGTIEFPYKLDFDLCLFYNGQKLSIEKNHTKPIIEFSFLDDKNTRCVYFIITDGITCSTQCANTLHALQIAPEHKYICYKLIAKREYLDYDNDDSILTWEVLEHTLEKDIIPTNSLIFLFNPALIAGLKLKSWKPENMFRIIPTLLINPQASPDELSRAITLARLAALDIDALHAKVTPTQSTNAILTALRT